MDDLSKKTVVILVILTLAVSIIGTWTVLNELSGVKIQRVAGGAASGKVSLTVINPNAEPVVPGASVASGAASLTISKISNEG